MIINGKNNRKSTINYYNIGLSKTGNTSLTVAFGLLGYKAVSAPSKRATSRNVFDFLTGVPACTQYPEFDKRYPGAKFIYTDRDIDSWLKSAKKFWEKALARPRTRRLHIRHIQEYGIYHFDATVFRSTYLQHDYCVKEYFKDRPEDLLIMRICDGDGWDKLCPFLGEKIPEYKFPWRRKQEYGPAQ